MNQWRPTQDRFTDHFDRRRARDELLEEDSRLLTGEVCAEAEVLTEAEREVTRHLRSMDVELLGIGAEEAEAKFGFLLDALKFGAPPHGGIAFGIDRIAALMAGTESIRDVIPFPKTTTAQCLMTGAPSPVPDKQLAEVHVAVRLPEKREG